MLLLRESYLFRKLIIILSWHLDFVRGSFFPRPYTCESRIYIFVFVCKFCFISPGFLIGNFLVAYRHLLASGFLLCLGGLYELLKVHITFTQPRQCHCLWSNCERQQIFRCCFQIYWHFCWSDWKCNSLLLLIWMCNHFIVEEQQQPSLNPKLIAEEYNF